MKHTIQTLMMTLALAVSAFASDNKLNFQVDFPFQVGARVLPAGNYVVMETSATSSTFRISDVAGKPAVFINLPAPDATTKNNSVPSISFRCGESGCSVASISNLRPGTTNSGFTPKQQDPKSVLISVRLNTKPLSGKPLSAE